MARSASPCRRAQSRARRRFPWSTPRPAWPRPPSVSVAYGPVQVGAGDGAATAISPRTAARSSRGSANSACRRPGGLYAHRRLRARGCARAPQARGRCRDRLHRADTDGGWTEARPSGRRSPARSSSARRRSHRDDVENRPPGFDLVVAAVTIGAETTRRQHRGSRSPLRSCPGHRWPPPVPRRRAPKLQEYDAASSHWPTLAGP